MDEAAIEVGESKEDLNILDRGGRGPFEDSGDLVLVHSNSISTDDVTEEVDLLLVELTLLRFDPELCFLKSLEDDGDVLSVFGEGVGVDEDVVEVNDAEDVEVLAKGVVHKVLEGGGSVGEAEGHDGVFEVAVTTAEGSFPLVSRSDPNEVVCSTKIKFGEEFCLGESIEGFGDEGEGVAILEGDLVESSVVDAKAERSVLLFDEKDGSSSGRG